MTIDGMSLNPHERDLLHQVHHADAWLVVVAHPDDESFGLGSVIARAAALGAHLTVACATRGEAGQAAPALASACDLGSIREGELHRAAALLGASRVELLGYRDSGFDGPPTPGSLVAAPIEEVVALIGRLLDEVNPVVVVVLDGGDGHRDHVRVRDAVTAAVRARAEPPLLVEHCYPNHVMREWLDEMRTLRPDTAYLSLDPASLGRADDEITDVLDSTNVIDVREAAMAEHRSQTSPYEGLSPRLRATFLGADHLVRVDTRS